MINYPNKLDLIFDKLKDHNLQPIIIGGFVRDALLKIKSKDIDVEIYGSTSYDELEDLLREFGSINIVGKSFGVCKLKFDDLDLDFSLPRVDNKISSGHRGFKIDTDSNLDFKTATKRRDFTINAIGYDIIEKKILDPFDGVDDLKNRVLRAVDLESFIEDPLRVLRAAQFCARFDLMIEPTLLRTCKDMVLKNMLEELPRERVFEEIKKLLLKSPKPSVGFNILKEFGTNLYTKNALITDEIVKRLTTNKQTSLVLMLSGLCHDMTQGEIENFILQFTNEKEIIKRVCALVLIYNKIVVANIEDIDDYFLYKLAFAYSIEEITILALCISASQNDQRVLQMAHFMQKRAKQLIVFHKKLPPLLHGKDLISCGLKPSQNFKKILEDAYEAQMHGKFKNHHEALIWLKNHYTF